jgi:phosphoribosylformylglycinamidine cyclo-ligase
MYKLRGVSSTKKDVYDAIKNIDFDPHINVSTFCRISPYKLSNQEFTIIHSDGVGSKSVLAYIYWKETGDTSVFSDLAIDSLVMNLDDVACAGIVDDLILLTNVINRNKHLIPGEVLKCIIDGFVDYINLLRNYNINIIMGGGETADLGDVVKTLTVDSSIVAGINKDNIIDMNNIQPGDIIIGFSSYGQSRLESIYNSGIGSNGLTAARHDCLNTSYMEKYPETYDQNIPRELCYNGIGHIEDIIPRCPLNLGKSLLSPTRIYMPMIKECLNEYKTFINGIIHCTGGGQTKCLKYGKNIKYVKNNMFDIPPIFNFILNTNKIQLKDMYAVYNMGHRLEMIINDNSDIANCIIQIAKSFGIDAKIIGYCEEGDGDNLLEITHNNCNFYYYKTNK